MMSDHPPRQDSLLLLGIPHPVTYALAAYLRGILATCDRPIDCELVTDDREVSPVGTALYLRPETTGTLGLAASLRHDAGADRLAGYALAARMDDRWRDVSRLAVERVLANPGHAVGTLSSCLGIPATTTMLAAADHGLATLRDAVAAFDHPLCFWLALGLEGTDAACPRLARDDRGTETDEAMPCGSARLDAIDGASIPDTLERVRSRLAPDGLLGGRERSHAAAARVASSIAGSDPEWAARVFVLAGDSWRALPVLRR